MGGLMMRISWALLITAAVALAACGDDDSSGVPCVADGFCQLVCANDPDCKQEPGGGGDGSSSGVSGRGPGGLRDLDDAGGPDPACPQGVVGGDVRITGEGDVDRIAGCISISGNLVIDSASVADLSALDGLESIGGSLVIRESSQLASLAGLQSLTRIGGDLIVDYNGQLADLSALGLLAAIGGDLRIRANQALASLEGLGRLREVGGSLYLRANKSLASAAGLSGLLIVQGNVRIGQNGALPTCEASELADGVHGPQSRLVCENLKDDCGQGECPSVW